MEAQTEAKPPGPRSCRRIATRRGLHYVTPEALELRRIRKGKNRFGYVDRSGKQVTHPQVIARIRSLAIPPAYTDVRIALDERAHLQAVGLDARGRRQYRYHPKWKEAAAETKYQRILEFGRVLPRLRKRVERDLRHPKLSRERVLAALVRLLDRTWIRVGNEEYARANHSFGLTTLQNRHVHIERGTIHFGFRGKSGIIHTIRLRDDRLARIVRRCRALPGHDLFQYLDEDDRRHPIHASDVNDYILAATGRPFTAKDFRTWAGTVLAAAALRGTEPPRSSTEGKRALNQAIETVASRLGNTKTVCRKSYIHPRILDAYLAGERIRGLKPLSAPDASIESHERPVLAFLVAARGNGISPARKHPCPKTR